MRLGVANRIVIAWVGVLLVAILGGGWAFHTARRTQVVMSTVVGQGVPAAQTAIALESALDDFLEALERVLARHDALQFAEMQLAQRRVADLLPSLQVEVTTPGELRALAEAEEEIRSAAAAIRLTQLPHAATGRLRAQEALLRDARQHVEVARARASLLSIALLERVESLGSGGSSDLAANGLIFVVWVLLLLGLGVALIALLFGHFIRPLRRLCFEVGGENASGGIAVSRASEFQALASHISALKDELKAERMRLAERESHLSECQRLAVAGKLAACLAHEIRNPLTSMKVWAFAIQRAATQDTGLQHKSLMLAREIARLQQLLANYLNLARPMPSRCAVAHVTRVLDETLMLFEHRIQRRHVQVHREGAPNLPPVGIEEQQLKQVFVNLIDNALDAMRAGGVLRILEHVEPLCGETPRVEIRFQDTGPGVPEDIRHQLFQPFVTGKAAGAGLGLSIAANLVERHGGKLTLESTSPRGSTFVLRMPAWKEGESPAWVAS